MDRLPTEVDENIVRRLPLAARDALSKVSRTYHAIITPYVYRDIVFDIRQGRKFYQLLATLLECRSLAAHIRTIAIEQDKSDTIPGWNGRLYARLLKHTNDIQELVKFFVADSNDNDPESTWSWICSIYAGMRKITIQGGPLALLLCMATNLECLDIECETMPSLDIVLSDDWRDRASQEGVPSQRLKVLRAALYIVQNRLPVHYALDNSFTTLLPPNLRTLRLENVRFEITSMEVAIVAPAFANLEELVVTRAASTIDRSPWAQYDFSRLSDLLVRHIPNLKMFEWSYMDYDTLAGVQPFGELSGLESLTSLVVDFVLIHGCDFSTRVLEHLAHPQTHLPPNLRNLHITDIAVEMVWAQSCSYLPNPSETALPVILNYIDRLHLSSIDLSFSLDSAWPEYCMSELPRRVREVLSPLLAALHKKGVAMTAWRVFRGGVPKILYAPGIAVPWPHLSDIPQDSWCEEAFLLWEVKIGKRPRPNDLRSLDDLRPDELSKREILYSEEFDEIIETNVEWADEPDA